jgi:hypothetical protein
MFCSGEKIELKKALSKTFGQCKVKDIHSSDLWTHVKSGKAKAKDVLLLPASELKDSVWKGWGLS